MRFFQIVALAALAQIAFPALAADSPPGAEPRVALVIGNASYKSGMLKNPVSDARAVATKLEALGFKVLLRENLDREAMHKAVGDFAHLLQKGGVGLFYYAGHGMQVKGRNFLLPVDADIQSEDDVEFRGMDANFVLSRMDGAHGRINILVLDACRNNPFRTGNRSANPGLAQMDAPKGTLIAFSTAPGALAKDGSGDNSVYTKHLVEYLSTPRLPVEQVFKNVRVAVARETHDQQIPWESSSLMGDFYFVPPTAAATPAPALPLASAQPAAPAISQPRSQEPAPAQPASGPAHVPAEAKIQPAAAGRDYNREGYEIEQKARTLTADELPALEEKAMRGDAMAQTTLGWAYFLGKGQMDGRNIPRSNPKMLKWTLAAARQGYPVAQNNLGAIYMDGVGVKMDLGKARHYFKLATDQGYLAAQRNLLQVSAMLDGKPDIEVLNSMLKNVQQQISKPVK